MRHSLFAALCSLSLLSAPAFAGGSDPVPAPKCEKGEVYDPATNKCVTKEAASPEALYEHAVRLIKQDGNYTGGLAILATLDQTDARVLNYTGYATRKSGDILKGMTYYYKALEKDPDYVIAREYLGEGYIQLGRVDLAKEQLIEIEKRCGTSCEAYEDLNDAISKAG